MKDFAELRVTYPRWRFETVLLTDLASGPAFVPRSVIAGCSDTDVLLVTSLSAEECWREVCEQVKELEESAAAG